MREVTESYFDEEPSDGDGQQEIPGTEEEEGADLVLSMGRPGGFDINLKLTVKGTSPSAKAETIQICSGVAPASKVEELLALAMRSTYFLEKLRGHVGQPETQD